MIKVGIVGGTGYTGAELLRLLAQHPDVEVTTITSRAESGKRVDALFPNLRGVYDLCFSTPSPEALAECDVVFFATPHGVAQAMMADILATGTRAIDLSADFRVKDVPLWEKWYKQAHACPELVEEAVYGLPEFQRDAIRSARLIACPGCYPTSVQLALMPFLEQALIEPDTILINAASGISGAGKSANATLLLAENYDNFRAYGVAGHRHLPEIEQSLRGFQPAGEVPANIVFVPHLLPMIRGIHSTIYVKSKSLSIEQLQSVLETRYQDEPFVDVLPRGMYPETRSVKSTNLCRISLEQQEGSDWLVLMSVIDNLAKGASAQAVQNMNLMFDLDERSGLKQAALLP